MENDYIITAVGRNETETPSRVTGRFIIVHLILVQSILVTRRDRTLDSRDSHLRVNQANNLNDRKLMI